MLWRVMLLRASNQVWTAFLFTLWTLVLYTQSIHGGLNLGTCFQVSIIILVLCTTAISSSDHDVYYRFRESEQAQLPES